MSEADIIYAKIRGDSKAIDELVRQKPTVAYEIIRTFRFSQLVAEAFVRTYSNDPTQSTRVLNARKRISGEDLPEEPELDGQTANLETFAKRNDDRKYECLPHPTGRIIKKSDPFT